jgi:hypothetical protein
MKVTIDLDRLLEELPVPLPCYTNFAPASCDGPDVSGLWQIFSAKLVHEEGGVSAFYGSDEGLVNAIGAKADRGVLLHIAALV